MRAYKVRSMRVAKTKERLVRYGLFGSDVGETFELIVIGVEDRKPMAQKRLGCGRRPVAISVSREPIFPIDPDDPFVVGPFRVISFYPGRLLLLAPTFVVSPFSTSVGYTVFLQFLLAS